MRYSPVIPLTAAARVIRSILLVGMLLGNLLPANLNVATICAILTLPVVVYELLRWLPSLHPVLVLVVPLFGLFALHALAIAPMNEYGADKLEKWVTTTLLAALAACLIRDKASVITFARTWVVVATVLAFFALANFQGGRADTFDANPIWLGRGIAFATIVMLWMLWQHRTKLLIALPVIAVLMGGLLSTGSRGPILSVVAGAIALAAFSGRYKFMKIVAIAAAGAVTFWALTSLSFFSGSRLNQLVAEGDTDQSRSLFWQITLPVISDNFAGVGIGNWAIYASPPSQFLYPHNLFLEIFVELGIPLGVLLVAVIATVLFRLIKRSRKDLPALLVLALFVGEIVSVNFSGDLNARTFFFVLALSYLAGSSNIIGAKLPDETNDATITIRHESKATQ